MKLVVLKYNAGNIQSVLFALERLGINALVTDSADDISSSDKFIFPGVGEAISAMAYLKERKLDLVIKNLSQPVFGICLGMQLLCKHSEEGNTHCLGVFDTNVSKFTSVINGVETELKVPQIGWNNISALKSNLFKGIEDNSFCYFVHSYYAELCNDTVAETDYGINFSSALQRDNFYGVQFHAEKSAAVGEKILKNFLDL
jgi:imidazole glycerol-phosphate synthase subunit HisH